MKIMKIFNIKPSPKLGEIIEALNEAQISGDVETKRKMLLILLILFYKLTLHFYFMIKIIIEILKDFNT